MKQIFFIFSILTFLSLISLVTAQAYWWPQQNDVINLISTLLNLPKGSLEASNFLWYVLVPFIAIWAIVLGFLRTLRIFPNQRTIELIIAFCMAFATLPTGIFMSFVNLLLGFSGVWATGVFFVMFIAGVFLYGRGWTGSLWQEKGTENKIRQIEQKIKDFDRKIAKADPNTQRDLIDDWEAQRNRLASLRAKHMAYLKHERSRRMLEYEE